MLTVSTRGRYALRIMVRLAMAGGSGPVTKHAVAESEGLSPDYVAQILLKLRAAGLVRSRRGLNGGYELARASNRITVTDVLTVCEGPIAVAPCLEQPCERAAGCAVHALWQQAGRMLEDLFSGVTLAELAQRARSHPKQPLFEI